MVQLWDTDLPIILNAGFPAGLWADAGEASGAGDLSAMTEVFVLEQAKDLTSIQALQALLTKRPS